MKETTNTTDQPATHTSEMPIEEARMCYKHFGRTMEDFLAKGSGHDRWGLYQQAPEDEPRYQVYGYKDLLEAERMIHRGVTPFMGPNRSTSQGCWVTLEEAQKAADHHGLPLKIGENIWRRPTTKEMDRLKRTDEGYYEHCAKGGLIRTEPGTPVPDPKPSNGKRGIPYRAARRPGRNQPCTCGSGLKFKRCCAK